MGSNEKQTDGKYTAGADIKEMQPLTFQACVRGDFLANWTRIARTKKPMIAAVNGFAVWDFVFEIRSLANLISNV